LFFPHFHINEVPVRRLQQALIRCFKHWGRPRSIKVDNGKPFGDPQRTSVPELALWLIALGIKVIWNPPRSPRKNAKVERMQATTAAWAEIPHCSSCQSLQRALDQAALIQREQYKARRLGGKSRKQVYPSLWTNRRSYRCDSFDVSRVHRYLSKISFKRKVNKAAMISFYAQYIYVGIQYKTKTVSITFEQRKKHFQISEEKSGEVFAYFPADNFSAKCIQTLSVCKPRLIKCYNFLSQKISQT
jgi:hypothetical protein